MCLVGAGNGTWTPCSSYRATCKLQESSRALEDCFDRILHLLLYLEFCSTPLASPGPHLLATAILSSAEQRLRDYESQQKRNQTNLKHLP